MSASCALLDPCTLRRADLPPTSPSPSRWGFEVHLDPALPKSMFTDIKRMQQIIKNLLSNAFQVHPPGQRVVTVSAGLRRLVVDHEELNGAGPVVAFAVTDTGIGIRAGEAAADLRGVPSRPTARPSRKYGGTGPWPRDLARSSPSCSAGDPPGERAGGAGSTFTALPAAVLPAAAPCARCVRRRRRTTSPKRPRSSAPRRPMITGGQPDLRGTGAGTRGVTRRAMTGATSARPTTRLLIVENDLAFAKVLLEGRARERGFRAW